ncbi:MAG: NAD(P)/FAD-dependent oxidoreductase, partial [Myxococcales bacterium]|nr:NAD(P)/FAD-dependent oxidoreductase [Myxococcales bacterium]
ESCHPAPDGTVASISRDDDRTAASLGGRDGDAWRTLIAWHRTVQPTLLDALLRPLPGLWPKLKLLPFDLLRFSNIALRSGQGLARHLFQGEAARRVMPGLALHVDQGPEDRFGAALGYMLATMAATGGNAVPLGGAQALTNALVRRLEAKGGRVRLGAKVERIVVRQRRAQAVVLADGQEIPVGRAVLANTDAAFLYLKLLEGQALPGRLTRRMRRFPRGWGTFKVDYALSAPVPWAVADARQAAVVHAGDSVADLVRFTRQVRSGALPEHPYLVIGQQSLVDRSRAPDGQHTLWVYTRVPNTVEGGWAAQAEAMADRVDARLEGLAPGFKATVLARRMVTPPDLEAFDANLVGGDLGGGSNAWTNQLVFRPAFPYYRYRTPITGAYLCSSYAHPGAGVHGMCGFNAAAQALRDLG